MGRSKCIIWQEAGVAHSTIAFRSAPEPHKLSAMLQAGVACSTFAFSCAPELCKLSAVVKSQQPTVCLALAVLSGGSCSCGFACFCQTPLSQTPAAVCSGLCRVCTTACSCAEGSAYAADVPMWLLLTCFCRAPKPTFIPVCHQLLPSKPPTPAIAAGGAAAKGLGVTATPTPMLGATPELNTRPGGKPLDPSVRRTLPASESTPNLVRTIGNDTARIAARGLHTGFAHAAVVQIAKQHLLVLR